MNYKYGIQMYSVRDMATENLGAALRAVGNLGFKQVEFAGFFDHSADEICKMMEDAGVTVCSTHSNWRDLMPEKIDETIAFHKAIGNKRFVIPNASLGTVEQLDNFISVVNVAKEKLAANGIDLGFHNHSVEFEVKYWGSTIHSELEKRTDLTFTIDTYWAFNAGLDPIALLERLGDRVKTIHLKDGFAGGRGVALGEGHAPVKSCLDYARTKDLNIVVESEGLQPTGIQEVERCMEYLKAND